MRFDSVGIFWQDAPRGRGGEARPRVMPPIPDTGWTPIRDLPNLAAADTLCIDLETFDPSIAADHGPGWARGVGHIAGVAVAADGDGRWYLPMRHTVEPETNLSPEMVLAWLRVELGRKHQPKVFANALYDVGWLRQEGVAVVGEFHDVQFAEALIDHQARVGLDILADKYLGESKVTDVIYRWLSDFYGGPATAWQRRNLYRAPPRLVAPYAIGDVDLPLRILARQYPVLEREGLADLYRMECDLIPLLVEMRFAGVTVDLPRAEQARDALARREKDLGAQLRAMVGSDVNVNAGDSLAKAFTKLGLTFPRTPPSKAAPKGRPSFTKEFLKKVRHPIGALIREVRKTNKTRSTFIESYILNAHVNGRVFPAFHPLKGDENGTLTGRFASSHPNYQNLPSRDEEMGALVRSIAIPDAGHKQWRKYDWSQLQYRFLAHYAVGPGSEALRATYNNDPKADYHSLVRNQIRTVTGKELDRKPVKNVNFGFVFGMGIEHLAEMLGVSLEEAERLAEVYHEGVPYVRETLKATAEEAQRFGVIRTVLGRCTRFDLWEPARWGERRPALPYAEAVAEYGNVKRAQTHKALNYRLQGSEGDFMKHCMLRAWNDGVFSATGVPRLTVHDELDFSDPGGADDAFDYLQHEIMERSMTFRVPMAVGCDVGPNWGACL